MLSSHKPASQWHSGGYAHYWCHQSIIRNTAYTGGAQPSPFLSVAQVTPRHHSSTTDRCVRTPGPGHVYGHKPVAVMSDAPPCSTTYDHMQQLHNTCTNKCGRSCVSVGCGERVNFTAALAYMQAAPIPAHDTASPRDPGPHGPSQHTPSSPGLNNIRSVHYTPCSTAPRVRSNALSLRTHGFPASGTSALLPPTRALRRTSITPSAHQGPTLYHWPQPSTPLGSSSRLPRSCTAPAAPPRAERRTPLDSCSQ